MYKTHIQDLGWESMKYNGQSGGTEGLSKRLEAIKIELLNYPGATVTYRTHVQNKGGKLGNLMDKYQGQKENP